MAGKKANGRGFADTPTATFHSILGLSRTETQSEMVMSFSTATLLLGAMGLVFGRRRPSALAGLVLIGFGAWMSGYF
jgi:hypothetical protein